MDKSSQKNVSILLILEFFKWIFFHGETLLTFEIVFTAAYDRYPSIYHKFEELFNMSFNNCESHALRKYRDSGDWTVDSDKSLISLKYKFVKIFITRFRKGLTLKFKIQLKP